MTADQFLVLGLFLGMISIPAMLSAWSDRRRPVVGLVVGLAGIAIVLYANTRKPDGYRPAEVPEAFYGVLADIIR
ncbi:hypothetical protein GCM10011415_18740 [Salipiger pallidus]|uniref:50S ribosomal protein L35 n=1 Tax=Salipiger pallidus TaxID=1775170 RepID=A0A8J2ZJR6_9RHOB|nr:hypothetical protein [Salipiger pallidus]GGG71200.1 hypothetical protein GCM10011415_18740 [Salipiger pallidus]